LSFSKIVRWFSCLSAFLMNCSVIVEAAAEVHARFRPEALVLDRHDRVVHHERDHVGREEELVVVGQDPDHVVAGAGGQKLRVAAGAVGGLELGRQRPQLRLERQDHAEDEGDQGQEAERHEDREQTQPADSTAALSAAEQPAPPPPGGLDRGEYRRHTLGRGRAGVSGSVVLSHLLVPQGTLSSVLEERQLTRLGGGAWRQPAPGTPGSLALRR
jgi:hypothetical protein